MQEYKAKMQEIVERANVPHDLPSNADAFAATPLGLTAGPKKPELRRVFGALG